MGFSIQAISARGNKDEISHTFNKFEGMGDTLEFGEEIHGRYKKAEVKKEKFRIEFRLFKTKK